MTTELQLLGAAVALGFVHLFWGAAAARRQQGLKWAAGTRDQPRPETGRAARLQRAFANYRETFGFFAAAMLTAHLGDRLGSLTHWGGWIYVVSRAVYLPLYAYPVGQLRSLAWFASIFGVLLVLAALFV